MNKSITEVHKQLIDFFSSEEASTMHRHFKQIFVIAAFESNIANEEEGKNALFSLWSLIEILDPIKTDKKD